MLTDFYNRCVSEDDFLLDIKRMVIINRIDESWLHWWNKSSAEQFYVDDLFILKAPEFHH